MPFRPVKNSVSNGNFGDILSGTATTTGNTAVAVLNYGTPPNAVVYFLAYFVGRRTDNGSGDGAVATLSCAYKNVGGVLTQIGTDTAAAPFASSGLAASAASSTTSGASVILRIAGAAGATVSWTLQSSLAIYSQ